MERESLSGLAADTWKLRKLADQPLDRGRQLRQDSIPFKSVPGS
jgi:hypothetical protein